MYLVEIELSKGHCLSFVKWLIMHQQNNLLGCCCFGAADSTVGNCRLGALSLEGCEFNSLHAIFLTKCHFLHLRSERAKSDGQKKYLRQGSDR